MTCYPSSSKNQIAVLYVSQHKQMQNRPYSPQACIRVNHSHNSVKNGWPANQAQQARGYNGLLKEFQRQYFLVLLSSSLSITKGIQEGANCHWKKRALKFPMESSWVPRNRDQHFSFENISYRLCNSCLPIWSPFLAQKWHQMILFCSVNSPNKFNPTLMSFYIDCSFRAAAINIKGYWSFTSYHRNKPPVGVSPHIGKCTFSMKTIKLEGSRWTLKTPLVSFGALNTPSYD